MSNPIPGPYPNVPTSSSLYTNEASSFVVVSSANSPFNFTGSYSNTLGFIVSNATAVQISGSESFAITGSDVVLGAFNPIPVTRVVATSTGRVLVLFGK